MDGMDNGIISGETNSENNIDTTQDREYYDDLYQDRVEPIEKHAELLKALTDFNPYLQDKMLEWCGLRFDKNAINPRNKTKGVFYKDPYSDPVMNLKGAKAFINYLRTFVRNNNILADLDETTFNETMLLINDDVTKIIADKYVDYEIKTSSDQSRIRTEIMGSARLILSGADAGAYKKFLEGVSKFSENRSYNYQNEKNRQKPNMIEKFKNMFSG